MIVSVYNELVDIGKENTYDNFLHSLMYSNNALTLIYILENIRKDYKDFNIISGFKSKKIMKKLGKKVINKGEYFFESATICIPKNSDEAFNYLQNKEDVYTKCLSIIIYNKDIITFNILTSRSLNEDEYIGCEFIDFRD